MANKWKIALFAAGGLLALLILAAVALVLFVDVNALKPRLEAAASDALGMEVRIGGRLGISLFPGFHIAVEDVGIRNRGADVASAKETILGIELLPLLHKELRIVKIGMKRPRISIEQDRDGKFNFETPEGEAGKKTAEEPEGMRFSVYAAKITLSDGALFYANKKTGEVLEAGDFTLDVSRLRLIEGESPDLLKSLSFAADFACKEFRKGSFAVSDLKLRVEAKDGRYAIRSVTAARLVHSGPGGKIIADRIALGVENLAVGGEGRADLLRRISFSGTAGIGELRADNLVITDLKSPLAGKDGVLELDPVTMRLFGGQGSGSLRADLSDSIPRYHVRYSLSKFRIEEFLKVLSPKKVAEGPMDLSVTLAMRGKTANEMKRTADGEVTLRGENLTLDGVDLDRVFSRYEASQSFNLVDVGAFFIAGPFAPLITKGYTFASLFRGSGGSSRIRALVSDWKVERGMARAKDVAMATNEHRVALKGSLDFPNERFDDVTIDPNPRTNIGPGFRQTAIRISDICRFLKPADENIIKSTRARWKIPCRRKKQGGVAMVTIRRTAWFFVLAIVMAGWMGVLGSFRGVAEASVIASHSGAGDLRAAELAKVQTVLEQKVVMQYLLDYGVSPAEAMAKVRSMSESDLHRIASLADRVAAGADGGVDFVIGLAVLVILILVILMLMNKRVVVR